MMRLKIIAKIEYPNNLQYSLAEKEFRDKIARINLDKAHKEFLEEISDEKIQELDSKDWKIPFPYWGDDFRRPYGDMC
jgi:hypothetical protein